MSSKVPSIHETFNARSLSTKDLCNTFIVNDHYYKLAASSNTIMVGPRGSGKTTLMRMLQIQSLEIWKHPKAHELRNKIDFTGVFIPTDRVWKTQYDKIREKFTVENFGRLEVIQASFTYHVLEKFVSAIEYLTDQTTEKENSFRSIVLTKRAESELVVELSNIWKVKPRINTLKSLEIAITTKKSEISSYLSIALNGDTTLNLNNQPETIVGDIETILGDSVRIANINLNDREHKWAFLFDELELAPENIVQPLVNSMRGGPDNIIFKLSLSPYHRGVSITKSPGSSMKDQDLSFISLTGVSDKFGYEFSKELCGNIFSKRGLSDREVEEYFEQPPKMIEYEEFTELSEKDSSFKDYLLSQEINISDLDKYTEDDKRPTIRKVKFVVQLRNYYRGYGKKKGRRRPHDLYAGFSNICKAMEYNPRMLIGIMNKFIPYAKSDKTIPVHQQLTCLDEMTNSFKALLNTIAVETNPQINSVHTIFDLVEKVAKYFQQEISGDSFRSEPKGTLSFKNPANQCIVEAIGFALNSGALIAEKGISVDSNDILDINSIKCRLSYMFSHKYGLLLSSQREVDLSEIIFPTENKKVKDLGMDDLFHR